MTESVTIETLLPFAAPGSGVARTILVAIRRLAIGGLTDAHATAMLMGEFGMAYRRPLMFLRVMLSEISRVSDRQISLAPCCCPRMTAGEATMLAVINDAIDRPERARTALAGLTGTLDCLPALSVAHALADALEDIGHPLRSAQNCDPSERFLTNV